MRSIRKLQFESLESRRMLSVVIPQDNTVVVESGTLTLNPSAIATGAVVTAAGVT